MHSWRNSGEPDAEAAGLVKPGHVALGGTKIEANASKHKERLHPAKTENIAVPGISRFSGAFGLV